MIKNMKISIKSKKQIEKMRIAGKLAAEVLEMIEPFVIPGVSTEELDKKCYEHIVNIQDAIPANIGYRGFEKQFYNKKRRDSRIFRFVKTNPDSGKIPNLRR